MISDTKNFGKKVALHAEWFMTGQRWHHLTRLLCSRGHFVTVFSSRSLRRSATDKQDAYVDPSRKRLKVVSKLMLPERSGTGVITRHYNRLARHVLKRAFIKSAADVRIWTGLPPQGHFPSAENVVYDCVDEYENTPWLPAGYSSVSSDIVRECAEILTVSRALQTKMASRYPHKTHLVPNGVDVGFFATARNRVKPEHPRIAGYMGAIQYWFDVELLVRVAELLPEWKLEIIGRPQISERCLERLRDRGVAVVGEVPYVTLPDRIARWSVGLIPFRLEEIILATSPIKLFEYLAAGLPVVATPMPEVLPYRDRGVVACADTADGFARAVRDMASEDRRAGREQLARTSSWEARFASFFDRWGL